MTTKERIKQHIDQLPEDKLKLIETLIAQLAADSQKAFPTGKLGLKEPFNRGAIYDDYLANRY